MLYSASSKRARDEIDPVTNKARKERPRPLSWLTDDLRLHIAAQLDDSDDCASLCLADPRLGLLALQSPQLKPHFNTPLFGVAMRLKTGGFINEALLRRYAADSRSERAGCEWLERKNGGRPCIQVDIIKRREQGPEVEEYDLKERWRLETEEGAVIVQLRYHSGMVCHYEGGERGRERMVRCDSGKIGWKAFYGCASLASITISDSVMQIGTLAFYDCTSLASIVIPASVTQISDYAFQGCTSLASITILGSVTHLGDGAFKGCASLASITILGSVTHIGDETFSGCTSLMSITIPGSVTQIGWRAFYGCASLASIAIPASVKHIGTFAFYGCASLTSITIPDLVSRIQWSAFSDCTSLSSITILGSVKQIDRGAWSAFEANGYR